tara:strand:+ start:319 stop:1182 length:864 start_codon:yes stop_codon:yes gene_type:complete
MKLLLENWRQYLVESEKAQDYGYLYLFEDDIVRKTSFYDALNLLSENENAIETFLENWERSVDYHIEQIDEAALAGVAASPVLYLSTQAFVFVDSMKDKVVKYASKIIGIVNKIKNFAARFKENHPIIYKIGTFAAQVIIAIVVLWAISSIFGGSEAQAGDLVSAPQLEGGEIVQKIIANEEELRKIGEAASNTEGLQDIGQEILNIANNPQDVQGGVGSSVSSMTQRVIKHGIEQLNQNEQAQTIADAAAKAAQNATKVVDVTLSDPEVAKKAQQAADIAAQAGIK